MSLIDKTTSGVKWSSISQMGRQLIQLVTTFILAQLLSPSEFGLVGMVMVVTGFVALFSDLGTSASVIQKKILSEALLSSIFWVNLTFGVFATMTLFLVAPIAANLYQEPRVTSIVRLLSFSLLIGGLSIVQQAVLERDLLFHKLAKIEMIAAALGSFVGIGLALFGTGVWSLVYQALVSAAATTVLLWGSSTWRPRAVFHWKEVKSVSSYSLNLTGFNVFNYFSRNADYMLIGRYLGAQDLGYYTIAYRMMFYPIQAVSAVIGRVMFPVYSQIQEDDIRFRRIYLKVVGAISLITFPLMLGLWALAKPFVLTVLGPKWEPVILPLMILAPVGMIQSIVTTVGAIYQAKGRTNWMFRLGMATGSVVIIAFVIGLHWGIVGVAIAYTAATTICLYPNLAISFRLINMSIQDLGKALWRPFLSSLLMFVAILGLKHALPNELGTGWGLILLVVMGGFVYLAVSVFINRAQLSEVMSLLLGKRRSNILF